MIDLSGDALDVARRILGWQVSTEFQGNTTAVSLTEVEAYRGVNDPASHAFRGRTPRNAAMFGDAGTLYVYRSYGVHWCMNLVVGERGDPQAVLLRGGLPTIGRPAMERRRGRSDHLADGPGKLCQALGVTGAHGGTSTLDGPVRLLPGSLREGAIVDTTPRVGISKAVDWPWRFVVRPGA